MAKARIGHFVEAQILEALEVDYIDESEVLTPADIAAPHRQVEVHRPVRLRLHEPRRGAAPDRRGRRDDPDEGRGGHRRHRQRGHAHARGLRRDPPPGRSLADELYSEAKNLQAPVELVRWVAEHGRLPVVTFTAGGIATPADAALCMQLGADGVFVGSGIFKSADPLPRAKAIVEATTHYNDAEILARVSRGLGDAMSGLVGGGARARRAARDPRLVDERGRPKAPPPVGLPLENSARLELRANRVRRGRTVEALRGGDGGCGELGHRRSR